MAEPHVRRNRMTSRVVFVLLLAPGLAAVAFSGAMVHSPLAVAVSGGCAIVLASLVRSRSHVAPDPGAPMPWVALAGACWMAALLAVGKGGIAIFLALTWGAVAAGSVAVADAFLLQRARVAGGFSRVQPWLIVAAAVLLLFVQPLLFPIVALVIALLRRREVLSQAGEEAASPRP